MNRNRTTDTNQASEGGLQRELERLYKCVVYDLIDDVDRKELWIKEIGFVVERLMRTEKLKLLAEVRERAQEVYTPVFRVDAVLISELNRLEAEL